ncbi:MAG: hypothetical protein HY366_02075 [Candidatus Aenigmarchaeota archaeon]|nr:hypothetical protein [Candidatus Aenigmarchaeota archaeon]
MDILSRIDRQLEDNENIVVVRKLGNFKVPTPRRLSSYNQTCYRLVAPRNGIYDVNGLNDFVAHLIKVPLPSRTGPFKENGTLLEFGYLDFLESIGGQTETREVVQTTNVEEWQNAGGFIKGRRVIRSDEQACTWHRTTFVFPYPDENIAQDLYKDHGVMARSMRLEDLKVYQARRL